jgi:transcriptional regulator with XRE-family HTH domain
MDGGGVSPKALGMALRERRTALGLSARDIGARASTDRSYVEGVERGERNPSLNSINRICAALDSPLSALVLRAEDIDARQVR